MAKFVDVETRTNACVSALMRHKEHAYTIGFLESQLKMILWQLPKTKQEQALREFESAVGSTVEVEVINAMTHEKVKIPFNYVGNPALDPSMEGYWSM